MGQARDHWAYEMTDRDPSRVILPVTAGPIERDDFSPQNGGSSYTTSSGSRRPASALPGGGGGPAAAARPGAHPGGRGARPRRPAADRERGRPADAWQGAERAEEVCRGVAALRARHPTRPRLVRRLGQPGTCAQRNGAHGEALAAYDRALAIDEKQAWVWNNKGNALNGLKRYEEALVAYDRALALDPNVANAWNNKGNALHNLKRYEEALAAYDRALALDPNLANAWNNKGVALDDLEAHEEALVAYDRALPSTRTTPKPGDGKGIVLLRRLGRTAEAEAAERRAKELGWKGRRWATALSPGPSPKREGSQRQRQSQHWRQMATLVA